MHASFQLTIIKLRYSVQRGIVQINPSQRQLVDPVNSVFRLVFSPKVVCFDVNMKEV